MRLLLLACSLALGCSFSGSGSGAPGSDDPDGGEDKPDAETDAAPLPLARCGTPGVLRGDFEGSSEWQLTRSADVTLSGNSAVLRPTSTSEATSLDALKAVDLIDAAVAIEVPSYPTPTADMASGFELVASGRDTIGFLVQKGNLSAIVVENDASTTLATIPIAPTKHRFLKLRETSGQLFFEVSADGATYEPIAMTATPDFVDVVTVSFFAIGLPGAQVDNGSIQWRGINATVNPANWCKADTLNDSFEQAEATWRMAALPTTVNRCSGPAAGGGTARAHQIAGGGDTRCYLETRAGFDLEESSATVEIGNIGNFQSTWWTYLEVVANDGERLQLRFFNDEMCARHLDASGAELATGFDSCISYQGNGHLYWRLSHTGSTLTAEVSPDLASWTEVDSIAPPFDIDNARLRFGTRSSTLSSGINLSVSSYNP